MAKGALGYYRLKKITTCLWLLLLVGNGAKAAIGQADSITTNPWKSRLEFSAYFEAYYQYDFNNPPSGYRPGFLYSHSLHNRIQVNLTYLKFTYNAQRIRASAAVMAGTYTEANLAAEPLLQRHIYEANFGFNLLCRKQLWLDAGVFSSHIGFESAVSKDCWNLTRSMMADNTPYVETGVKLTYLSDNGRLSVAGLVLNGWQRIKWIKGNTLPSFGWQLTVKPTNQLLINSSSFLGSNYSDTERKMRLFHNLYLTYNLTPKLGFTTAFDIGAEQQSKGSGKFFIWHSSAIVLHYAPTSKLALATRFEHYHDPGSVMIATDASKGFSALGYALNLDYLPLPEVALRAEGRLLQSLKGPCFSAAGGSTHALSPSVCISIALAINHLLAKQGRNHP